ncbi:MAG: hypothetical protein COZ21_15370, partial [Bacteroidetes bacterium CG_4_10_14_3_um_filter_31_20]
MNSGNEVSVFGLIRVNIKTNFGMFACYGVSSPGTWNLRQVGSTGRASFISGQDNTGAGEIEGTPAGNTSDLEGRGFVLLSGFFDGSTNEWRLYENDSLMHTNTNTFTLSSAQSFYIGHRNNSFKLDGDIVELLVYNRNLSDSEKTFVKTYLYYKYAPPVNLGPDITANGFCDTTIHAGVRFTNYVWNTGNV